MPVEECLTCKNLLIYAGRTIVAHLRAVNRLETKVIEAPADDVARLEEDALEAAIARENAVHAYEEHRASHADVKTRKAGY